MPQIKKKSFVQKNGLIAVWSMAGFMAMGYIGFLATGSNSPQSKNLQLATAGASSTNPVEQQLATLNATMKKLANKTETTSRELSLIKEAFGPNTASLPNAESVEKEKKAKALLTAKASPENLSAKVSINVLPLTESDKVAVLSGTDPSESYGIDLAQARSVGSLKRYWKKLEKTNNSLFSGLKPRYINRGTAELPVYSLILGPFDLKSKAQNRCQQLAKISIECDETHYRAEPFENIQTAGK